MPLSPADDIATPAAPDSGVEATDDRAGIDEPEASRRDARLQTAFIAAVLVLFAAALLYTNGLTFEVTKDERQFESTTALFAQSWPPDTELLRSYPEPMTPLSFVVWGWLERSFEGGISLGRQFNFVLCFIGLLVVGLHRGGGRRAVLAGVGLLLYPYWLLMGMHLYTDLPSAFLVLLAFSMPQRSIARSLFFMLAIATRQYMVIFPAALVVDEIVRSWRAGDDGWLRRVAPDAIAAASLLFWIAFFGGLGPQAGLERWPKHMDNISRIHPELGLYFLTTMGVYFVLPECVLFRHWDRIRDLWSPRSIAIAAVLLGLFLYSPPIFEGHLQGFFGRVCYLLPVPLRVSVFFLFAWLAAVRFSRVSLSFWMVAMQLAIILTAWSAWEKYALPVIAALWLLKASGRLDAERTPPQSALARG